MTKYIGKDATVMLNGEGKVVIDLGSTSKSGAKPMNSTSVTIRLPQLSSDLLREVIEKRAPELLPMLREGSEVVIREDQKRDIQELIGDEFSQTGLRDDHEPNDRGLALEKLIDVFSPFK
ncbi:MAG: hypothetical protein EPO25_14670 [Gammaproteobacteria bacterium]|nr:MAG: hypothetical protein EPO25_14670 [Gammaproteobacteria bacterium]